MVRKQFLVDGHQVKRTLIGLSTGWENNGASCTGYNFLHSVDVDWLVMNGVFVIDSRTGVVYQGRNFSTREYTFRRNCDGDICIKYDILLKRNRRSILDAFGCDDGVEVTAKALKRNRKESLGDDAEERLETKVLKRNRMQALGDYGDGEHSTKSKFLK